MTTRRVAILQIAWLATGCSSLLAPIDTSTSAALIDRLPEDVPRAARPRGVLVVHPPTSRPVYDTTRMAYSLAPHRVEFFARHEWAERPAQMLQPLLVRTLEAARCCTAIMTPASGGPGDFSLRTELRELVQDFSVEPPRLRLGLRIVIGARDKILDTHDIEIAETMLAKNAEAGVVAANLAMTKALRAIAQHVIDALA